MTIFSLALILIGSLIQGESELKAPNPQSSTIVEGIKNWFEIPILASRESNRDDFHLIVPGLQEDDRFEAIRIDAATEQQTTTYIALSPESEFRFFTPADVRLNVDGLSFCRSAIYLVTSPEGKGPVFHLVDSAIGQMKIILEIETNERVIPTRSVFNSDETTEHLSLVSADPFGKCTAVVMREAGGFSDHISPARFGPANSSQKENT